jgi:hypothetical protein
MSSVASFDGELIQYDENLSCDDAYRVTKNLQEKIISNWCEKKRIKKFIIYPSAIFLKTSRSDTNIGKLQKLSKNIPFVPYINVKKSLTFLPFLSNFVIKCLEEEMPQGRYLAVERPVLCVTEIIKFNIKKNLIVIKVPFLKQILYSLAVFLYVVGGFGRIDLKLTPNRVMKIFRDTSYNEINSIDSIDSTSYNQFNNMELAKIFINNRDDCK